MVTVELRHLKALGYCNRGARRWLLRRGVSWGDFLRNGINVELIRATGDTMAEKAAILAEGEHE